MVMGRRKIAPPQKKVPKGYLSKLHLIRFSYPALRKARAPYSISAGSSLERLTARSPWTVTFDK